MTYDSTLARGVSVVAANFLFHRVEGKYMDTSESISALDEAVTGFAQKCGDAGSIITGWALSVSFMHPSRPGSDGYLTAHSAGLPHHTQLGLFYSAIEEMKTTSLMNQLRRSSE